MARQHHDFIARHARDDVSGTQGRLHLACGMAQHLIAHGMAIAVIDVLETVKVEQDNRHFLATAVCRLHQTRQLLHKPGAVRQPGQRVTMGHELQLLLALLLLRDIGEHAHVMRCFALRILHRI
ncbi:hypothetical protein D3C72_2018080 [compost metagenome]